MSFWGIKPHLYHSNIQKKVSGRQLGRRIWEGGAEFRAWELLKTQEPQSGNTNEVCVNLSIPGMNTDRKEKDAAWMSLLKSGEKEQNQQWLQERRDSEEGGSQGWLALQELELHQCLQSFPPYCPHLFLDLLTMTCFQICHLPLLDHGLSSTPRSNIDFGVFVE